MPFKNLNILVLFRALGEQTDLWRWHVIFCLGEVLLAEDRHAPRKGLGKESPERISEALSLQLPDAANHPFP
jgi:hypothetical protein